MNSHHGPAAARMKRRNRSRQCSPPTASTMWPISTPSWRNIATKLESAPPKLLDPGIVNFEAFFNHFAPFESAWGIYLLAILLALVGVLLWKFKWSVPIQKSGVRDDYRRTGAAHIRLDRADLHLRSAAGHDALFCRRIHRLGRGRARGRFWNSMYRVGLGNLIAAAPASAGLGDGQPDLPISRRRQGYDRCSGGGARHAVLVGHARRLCLAGICDHVRGRRPWINLYLIRHFHARPRLQTKPRA